METKFSKNKMLQVDLSKGRGAAGAGQIAVVRTANGDRIRISQMFLSYLGFTAEDIGKNAKKFLKLYKADDTHFCLYSVSKEPGAIKVSGTWDRPIIYSTQFGNALLAPSGKELLNNKTASFKNVICDTDADSEKMVVINVAEISASPDAFADNLDEN